MGYVVPLELPEKCNHCPFGMPHYNHPFGRDDYLSPTDGKTNKIGSYGYVCNIEFYENNRYTKVLRANIDEDIEKPEWCKLKATKEDNDVKNEQYRKT